MDLPRLAARRPDSHKGDFGRALLIGGSCGMSGAIALAGQACLRSGAGLVKLAVPECIQAVVAGYEPSYMTVSVACDRAGRIKLKATRKLRQHLESATCVACGPGLGQSKRLDAFVAVLYETLPQPLVLDADGLNALASALASSDTSATIPVAGPRVLTPHPGELARLVGAAADARPNRDEQVALAQLLARERHAVVVLKGHRTIITDGTQVVENTTGNPGLATGGTGDVLTGVITALICQNFAPFEAAVLGAHVQGLAGDLAAAELGQVSLIASDLLRFLAPAFRQLA
jgi:ADP-dependent NAD(P)H-hydrate dehydratase